MTRIHSTLQQQRQLPAEIAETRGRRHGKPPFDVEAVPVHVGAMWPGSKANMTALGVRRIYRRRVHNNHFNTSHNTTHKQCLEDGVVAAAVAGRRRRVTTSTPRSSA